MGVIRTVQGLRSVYGTTSQDTVSVSSSTQLEMMLKHQHQLGQVFGDLAATKYNECTGTIETVYVFGRLQGT